MAALGLRSWVELKSTSFMNPEKACMVSNGIMATRLISGLPADGSWFLDVGAHIGSVFSAIYYRNRTVKIAAMEADRSKAADLARRFPYCKVFNYAAGEKSGVADFNLHEQSGYNSLVKGAGTLAVEVEVRRLDELFPETVFDVIKLDVEGAELGVLRGAETLLKRSRPTIMFESVGLEENSLGYSPAKLWHWLASRNYVVFTPDRLAHDAPALSLEAFLDAHAYPIRTHNYFAIASERRVELRDKARRILGIRMCAG